MGEDGTFRYGFHCVDSIGWSMLDKENLRLLVKTTMIGDRPTRPAHPLPRTRMSWKSSSWTVALVLLLGCPFARPAFPKSDPARTRISSAAGPSNDETESEVEDVRWELLLKGDLIGALGPFTRW